MMRLKFKKLTILIFSLIFFLLIGCGRDDGSSTSSTPATDTESVALAYADLTTDDIIFTGTETASTVTSNFVLPLTGLEGTTISWGSNSGTIVIAGSAATVTRPNVGTISVTLTATISKGTAAPETKDISITVIGTITTADKYVSATGSDSNDGTLAAPYLTIAKAILETNGTTIKNIFVSAGTYAQGSTSLSISSKSNIGIYGGFNVGFTARDAVNRTNATYKTEITYTGTERVVSPSSCPNFIIDGFAITTATGKSGFYASGDTASTTISNCTVSITGTSGDNPIYIIGGTLNKVENCIIDLRDLTPSGDSFCIDIYSPNDCIIKNNTVYPSEQIAGMGYLMGIRTSSSKSVSITGNTVSFTKTVKNRVAPVTQAIVYNGNIAVDDTFDVIIANNTISSTATAFSNEAKVTGIYLNDSDTRTFVANNVIALSGVVQNLNCIYLITSGANTGRVYSNTIYIDATTTNDIRGINAQDPGMIIKNNIIVTTFSTGTFYGIDKNAAGVCENNLIYSPNKTDTRTYDASNITGTDPSLDTANGFILLAGSPASVKTGGLNLYADHAVMQTDKAGAARPSTGNWSIGAYIQP